MAAYNFLFAGKECVALEALRPVDGDEGEHVGEELVSAAVGDPGQGHGVRRPVQWEESLTRDILAI